jgi:hypothetical protein
MMLMMLPKSRLASTRLATSLNDGVCYAVTEAKVSDFDISIA